MSARKMKDSGIEWIGEIPEEWEISKIKHLLSTPITDGPHETPEILEEGIPFISAEAVKNLKVNFELKRGFISQIDHERFCKKCKPQFGDIFMVKSGATTGNIARVDTHEEFSIWSPLALIRVKNTVIKRDYMFYFLQSNLFRLQVELFWSYGTQQNIGMEVLENLYAPYPSLGMQQKIVAYLDEKCGAIDQIVISKQKQNEQLAEYRQRLITEAVTKGLNPSVPMKDSGIEWIGEIPEKWQVKKLRYLGEFSSNGVDKKIVEGEDTYKSVHYMDVYRHSMQEIGNNDNYLVVSATKLKAANCDLKKGDAIFTNSSETPEDIGHSTVVKEDLDNTLMGYHLMRFRPNEELTNKYERYLFGSMYVRSNLAKRANGITRYGISYIDFADILIPYPNVAEQKEIAAYLDKKCGEIDALSERNKNIIGSLQEYKQSLIYEAVTGKIEL